MVGKTSFGIKTASADDTAVILHLELMIYM